MKEFLQTYKLVIVLRYYEGMTDDEIMMTLDISSERLREIDGIIGSAGRLLLSRRNRAKNES